MQHTFWDGPQIYIALASTSPPLKNPLCEDVKATISALGPVSCYSSLARFLFEGKPAKRTLRKLPKLVIAYKLPKGQAV